MKRFLATFSATDVRNIIAITYVTLALTFLFVLAFKAIPPENKDLVNIIGGSIFSGLGIVLSFFFGASKKDISETVTK